VILNEQQQRIFDAVLWAKDDPLIGERAFFADGLGVS